MLMVFYIICFTISFPNDSQASEPSYNTSVVINRYRTPGLPKISAAIF